MILQFVTLLIYKMVVRKILVGGTIFSWKISPPPRFWLEPCLLWSPANTNCMSRIVMSRIVMSRIVMSRIVMSRIVMSRIVYVTNCNVTNSNVTNCMYSLITISILCLLDNQHTYCDNTNYYVQILSYLSKLRLYFCMSG